MPDTTEPLCIVRGSINIDEFFHVPNIVHPGQTLSSTKYERRAGGKGANQAVAIAKAGGRVVLCGAAGDDGAWMLDDMMDVGVGLDGVIESEGPTGRAIIQLSPEGENSIVLLGGANTEPASQSQCDVHLERTPHTHLLLQNEIPWSSTLHALEISHHRRAVTFFNPSPMPSSEQLKTFPWDAVNWLIVNEGEAEGLLNVLKEVDSSRGASSHTLPPSDWPQNGTLTRAFTLLHSLKAVSVFPASVNIVCTLGSLGVIVLPSNSPPFYVPAAVLDRPVVDTTGAGDCFTGYFVAGFMHRGSEALAGLKEIVEVAVKAAGICVTRAGAAESVPKLSEVAWR